jgi:hypothetical protein
MCFPRLGAFLVAFVLAIIPIGTPADAPAPGGTVLLAKTGEQALVIWDATSTVTTIVSDKTPRDVALQTLESQAVTVAASKAPVLPSAKTITVRIIYEMSGDVSPVYKTATFTGFQHLVAVTVPKLDLAKNAASYSKALAAGTVPADVKVDKTGDLPPL